MSAPTDELKGLYRTGFNDATEGAKRFLELNIEIVGWENHECPTGDFEVCHSCRRATEITREQNEIAAKWSNAWAKAVLKDSTTLPVHQWCECSHISGQHGIDYPHVCATGGHDGCENGCKGFRSVAA